MRKHILTSSTPVHVDHGTWLDVASLAQVEVSSESADYPIENAFDGGSKPWRAAVPGPQTIRVLFDVPQTLRVIQLRFIEPERARTQQFTLSWGDARTSVVHEIVRQQWNFSPGGSTEEAESYNVDLPAVTSLQLDIVPDVGGSDAVASLAEWRLA